METSLPRFSRKSDVNVSKLSANNEEIVSHYYTYDMRWWRDMYGMLFYKMVERHVWYALL